MTPKSALLAEARSKLTEEKFDLLQANRFNQFGNIVTYRCYESFIFPDRTFEKSIECTFKSGKQDEVEWQGYGGTSLPLPKECNCKLFSPPIHRFIIK